MQKIEHQGFLLLLTAVTLAFAWVLYPFYGAVLWAIVVAVLFAPVYRRLLQSMQGRPSLAAALTVLIIIAMVILPFIVASLVQEASSLSPRLSREQQQSRQLPAADIRRPAGHEAGREFSRSADKSVRLNRSINPVAQAGSASNIRCR